MAATLLVAPLTKLRVLAQAPLDLSGPNILTLKGIAEVVLPSDLDEAGRTAVVDRFVLWIREYREGADRGHTYGASVVSAPTGRSPLALYPPQFAAMDQYAKQQDFETFAAASLQVRRDIVQTMLQSPQRVMAMPARPNGLNLVADFMGWYFNSAAAYDLAYNAAIGRDSCRTLDGSDRPPAPLSQGA